MEFLDITGLKNVLNSIKSKFLPLEGGGTVNGSINIVPSASGSPGVTVNQNGGQSVIADNKIVSSTNNGYTQISGTELIQVPTNSQNNSIVISSDITVQNSSRLSSISNGVVAVQNKNDEDDIAVLVSAGDELYKLRLAKDGKALNFTEDRLYYCNSNTEGDPSTDYLFYAENSGSNPHGIVMNGTTKWGTGSTGGKSAINAGNVQVLNSNSTNYTALTPTQINLYSGSKKAIDITANQTYLNKALFITNAAGENTTADYPYIYASTNGTIGIKYFGSSCYFMANDNGVQVGQNISGSQRNNFTISRLGVVSKSYRAGNVTINDSWAYNNRNNIFNQCDPTVEEIHILDIDTNYNNVVARVVVSDTESQSYTLKLAGSNTIIGGAASNSSAKNGMYYASIIITFGFTDTGTITPTKQYNLNW